MKINDIVFEVLNKHWQDDVDIVGSETVREIIAGETVFEGVGSGQQLPFEKLIIDLAAAVTFIRYTIEIVLIITKNQGHHPTADEVEKEADDQGIHLQNADAERSVIETVVDLDILKQQKQ